MPLPEPGQLYLPVAGELRDQMLADYRLEWISQGLGDDPPVQPGTDNHRWFTAIEGPLLLNIYNAATREDQGNPLTATGDDLDTIRAKLGLPELPPTGASGKIKLTISGSANVPAGTQLTLTNGKRLRVVGAWIGLANGAEIDVAAIDTGEDTNAAAGDLIRFVNAPLNVDTEAKVSFNVPLTGGTAEEDDGRKRARILSRIQNPPAGGNWSQKREVALDALATVQDCFIYPALGGPASELIVPVKAFDPDLFDFSRALDVSAMAIVRNAIQAEFDSPDEIVVKAPVNQSVDVSILVSVPDAATAGGNGQGWTDAVPWPQLEVADAGRVTVSTVTTSTSITVSANTATSPTTSVTRVAWWSPTCRKFYRRQVVGIGGSAGAWVIDLDAPLTDDAGVDVAVGDYICPDAISIEGYGKTWIEIIGEVGPGEATADANRLPRSLRHPYVTSKTSLAPDLKASKLALIREQHSEVTDYEYGYRSVTTPAVPAAVSIAPNILVPRHFGIYKQ